MAHPTVVINGVSYANTPEVDIPKQGGGTAKFYDATDCTAASADLLTGKKAITSTGEIDGGMANNGSTGGTISTKAGTVSIPAGYTSGGSVSIATAEQNKIIAGKDKAYNGEVVFSPGYSVGMLDQEPELDNNKTVKEVVQEGIQEVVDILKRYEEVNARFMEELTDDEMNALVEEQGQLTDLIEQHDAWDLDSKLERAMDALNCPDGDTPVKNLSGGERRRVEIARALANDPKFILLDEPFAGIDPIAVNEIRGLVSQLKNRGLGVIITDHNVRETLSVVDRAYIMASGEVLLEGSSDFLVNDERAKEIYLGPAFTM